MPISARRLHPRHRPVLGVLAHVITNFWPIKIVLMGLGITLFTMTIRSGVAWAGGGDPGGGETLRSDSDAAVNFAWTLSAAFMVFFMQAGFALDRGGLHQVALSRQCDGQEHDGLHDGGHRVLGFRLRDNVWRLEPQPWTGVRQQAHRTFRLLPGRRRLRRHNPALLDVPRHVRRNRRDHRLRRNGRAHQAKRLHGLHLLRIRRRLSRVRALGLGRRMAGRPVIHQGRTVCRRLRRLRRRPRRGRHGGTRRRTGPRPQNRASSDPTASRATFRATTWRSSCSAL